MAAPRNPRFFMYALGLILISMWLFVSAVAPLLR